MRTIHRLRKSRLRTRRERYMCIQACCTASLAAAWQLERLPRKPLACLSRRLRRRRALKPLFARGIGLSSSRLLSGPVREHRHHLMVERVADVATGTQVTLALGRALRQQVALERLLVLELARAGLLEPL